MGGGVAFPGFGGGKGGGGGKLAKVLWGESGEEWSPILAKPRLRLAALLTLGLPKGWDNSAGGGRLSEEDKVAGSKFKMRRDSRSSRGSCNHGP